VASKRKPPAEVVAFDVNENTVAVARLSLLATVDRVASWNRQYINPAVYSIETDFRRLAKRYEAVREKKLEEVKQRYPFAGRDEEERRQNVADTREFRRFARRLRERRRKEGRVRQVAREVTKSPAVIITEGLGKNPQEEMIGEKEAKKGDRAEGSCEEGESHRSAASRIRHLGFAHGAEGQPPVARGAGPGRPHDPRPRRQ
jgi:putative transposase